MAPDKKRETIAFRIRPDLKAKLQEAADKMGISISALVEDVLCCRFRINTKTKSNKPKYTMKKIEEKLWDYIEKPFSVPEEFKGNDKVRHLLGEMKEEISKLGPENGQDDANDIVKAADRIVRDYAMKILPLL